jgi:uncharacterized membrane protein
MEKSNNKLFIFLIVLGIALAAAGFIAGSLTEDDELSSRLIGFGSGFSISIFAVAIVNLVILKINPNIAKEQEINAKDERQIKISEKSALSTFFITIFSLLAAIIVYVFLGFYVPLWITIGLLLIHTISFLIFLHHNRKTL